MTSLKKLTAVLAVSLPLLAVAQTPPAAPAKPPLVTVYGTLNANIQYTQAYGGTAGAATNVKPREGISLDSSNIGVRGTFDVNNGLGVVYQCETSAKLDGITTNVNTTPATLAFLCDRNSRLGLSSPYGTLFLGNWDTPFKAAYYGTKADDPFGNTDVYGTNDIMGSPGFNKASAAWRNANTPSGASFDLRAQNSIAYHSPKYMGFSAKFQHGVREFASNNDRLVPYLWSAVVNYDQGPLSVFGAWERHDDWFGLASMAFSGIGAAASVNPITGAPNPSTDTSWRAGAGYELVSPFGATTLGFVWEMLKYEQKNLAPALTNVKEYSRSAIAANAKHRTGNHEFRGRFNFAGQGECKFESPAAATPACSTSGLGAHQVTLGYAYYLAASAQVYAFYTRIQNSTNARYTFGAGGSVSGTPATVATTAIGQDPVAVGLGLRYAF